MRTLKERAAALRKKESILREKRAKLIKAEESWSVKAGRVAETEQKISTDDQFNKFKLSPSGRIVVTVKN